MEWVSDGRLRSADFDLALPAVEAARRLRTALDSEGEWMGEVLRDGDARLSEVRADGHPDAGGLVIASDQDHARAIAARLESVAGESYLDASERQVGDPDDPGHRGIAGLGGVDVGVRACAVEYAARAHGREGAAPSGRGCTARLVSKSLADYSA